MEKIIVLNKFFSKATNQWKTILGGIFVGIIVTNIFSNIFSSPQSQESKNTEKENKKEEIQYWTCSMHPQIKLPHEGLCPLCAMDLIPLEKHESEYNSQEDQTVSLTLNRKAIQLAEIEVEKVSLGQVSNKIRLVGKVAYDESRLSYISAWVPGRIDKIFVDFTGTKVREGDHLIKIYSPELLATQEEYLQAVKNLNESKDSNLSLMRNTSKTTLQSSREKLQLYGINEKQIDALLKRGMPEKHMTIYSPVSGTVIHKNGFEGMYLKTGDKIYTIADLSQVWLHLDAYESDIQWLHYGQNVVIEAESYPGEIFQGKIAFIDPYVNDTTRTIKLRVNVDNIGEKLKPGMFVRTTIKATLGDEGKIYEETLAGKWICPMHPDIIKKTQEMCDICGMDLIPTKEFGFADNPTANNKVLTISKTAPLITGKRAVVYVENNTNKDTLKRYEGREIILGPRAGDRYIVLSGLSEGEKVVVKGNFKIDSALQIQASPSMMNPGEYYNTSNNNLSQNITSKDDDAGILAEALPHYLAISMSLAQDDPHSAVDNLQKFKKKIEELLQNKILEDKKEGILPEIQELMNRLQNITHDIESLRLQFKDITDILKNILDKYAYHEDLKLYLTFCPMAFNNKGAYWLQHSPKVMNPYFGKSMLECGSIQAEYGKEIIKKKPKEPKGSKGSRGGDHPH